MSNVVVVSPDSVSGDTTTPMDTHGALVPAGKITRHGAPTGDLLGLTFVAKDLFDIAGQPTGGGSPARRASSPAADQDAAAVAALLDAGATLVGRARCDALAFGLSGVDTSDGAPRNPVFPSRVPGGSSSGSAVAVAVGIADLGLATDTGGSIRVPAAYCGLYGWRPTHGAVSVEGMLPLAGQFDTVGLLARDAWSLARGADVLLVGNDPRVEPTLRSISGPIEAVALCDPDVAAAYRACVVRLGQVLGVDVVTRPLGIVLERCRATFQALQAHEAWALNGSWIQANPNALPEAVELRFRRGERIDSQDVEQAEQARRALASRISEHVHAHGLVAIPAAPTLPPPLGQGVREAEDIRNRTLAITSIAGLAGLPCVVIPIDATGRPSTSTDEGTGLWVTGLCLVGPSGSDRWLLDVATAWVQQQEAR